MGSPHQLATITSRQTVAPQSSYYLPPSRSLDIGQTILRETEILVFYHNGSQRRSAGSGDQTAQDRSDSDV